MRCQNEKCTEKVKQARKTLFKTITKGERDRIQLARGRLQVSHLSSQTWLTEGFSRAGVVKL